LTSKLTQKTSLTKFDTLKKALDLSAVITPQKAKQVMAALNQPTYQDEQVLMGKVKEIASSKPDLFIQTYESNETPIRAMIREAIDAKVLDHDLPTGKVTIDGMVIATLKTETTELFVPSFAKWLNTAENGKDVLNNIKSRLEKKEVVK